MVTLTRSPVFDYKALRLLVGIIALALPYVVIVFSTEKLASISASYYSEARDYFIGMLFIVSAFLWAYNGHTVLQKTASKVASLAACLVALCPTSCNQCNGDASSAIHTIAAAVLFSILAYFCFGPFYQKVRNGSGKKKRRAVIYLLCGWAIVLAMLVALVAKIALTDVRVNELRVIYWVELVALNAFGIGWITAGKYLPLLVDKEDALVLMGKRR